MPTPHLHQPSLPADDPPPPCSIFPNNDRRRRPTHHTPKLHVPSAISITLSRSIHTPKSQQQSVTHLASRRNQPHQAATPHAQIILGSEIRWRAAQTSICLLHASDEHPDAPALIHETVHSRRQQLPSSAASSLEDPTASGRPTTQPSSRPPATTQILHRPTPDPAIAHEHHAHHVGHPRANRPMLAPFQPTES